MRLRRFGPCLVAITMLAPAARAGDGLPRIHAGAGLAGLLSEIRFGATAHDVGGKEGGADLNGELLFATPVPARLTEGLSPPLRWLAEPRPDLGVSINTAGFTSTGYFGLTWTTLLARDLLRPGDRLRLDVFFGESGTTAAMPVPCRTAAAWAAACCSGWAARSATRSRRPFLSRSSSSTTRMAGWPASTRR